MDSRRLLVLAGLFVAAPILTVGVMLVVLLAGMEPHSVFLPGHALLALLRRLGIHAPNAVGVVAATVVWWLLIVLAWVTIRSAVSSCRETSRRRSETRL